MNMATHNSVSKDESHLKIISVRAAVGVKYSGIEPQCCERVVGWIDDAIHMLSALKEKADAK